MLTRNEILIILTQFYIIGMMQSGVSRELFESWCTDKKNGCIVAGYCVEGTLAKLILSHPTEITAMNGQKLPLNMKVEYISFSAHTDYPQTSGTDLITGCASNSYYLFKKRFSVKFRILDGGEGLFC